MLSSSPKPELDTRSLGQASVDTDGNIRTHMEFVARAIERVKHINLWKMKIEDSKD